jgi:lipopolysaccharide biosynthesis glycosyltransferase
MGTLALVRAPGRPTQHKREDWGAPGRWKTANMYVKKERDFQWDARRLESQVACTLGRIMKGQAVVDAWRASVNIHVAFCFDVGFIQPTLVAIGSLLYHNNELPLVLHLKHLNVPATALTEMQTKIHARFPATCLSFSACHSTRNRYNSFLPHVTEATMGRLWLHEDHAGIDRIIYIDGDCIVRGSIAGLLDLSVTNIAARTATFNTMKLPQWNGGHPWPHNKSINAGVLVLNLRRLRKNNFSAFVESVLKKSPLNDQSILNLYLQGAHQELGREFNFFWKEASDISSPIEPLIVHFAGSVKPWHQDPKKPAAQRSNTGARRDRLTAEWHAYKHASGF